MPHRGLGAQTATVLVREGFVRHFRSAKALGSYAGLVGTPYASGSSSREQGISRAGNRRLRTAVVELAWLWVRYQPGSALASWFATRLGKAGGRMRKVLVVALARKLLIALWRFAVHGVVPEGARAKPASLRGSRRRGGPFFPGQAPSGPRWWLPNETTGA